MADVKYRISKLTATFMLVIALIIDLVELLLALLLVGLVLNRLITLLEWFIFGLWFTILGVPFFTGGKRMATTTGGIIIGLIPGVGALPEFTLSIFLLILISRSEDRDGIIGKAVTQTVDVN